MKNKITYIMLLATLIAMPSAVFAEKGMITAHVVRTLVADGGIYGGCMIAIDKTIATQSSTALNCPSVWVTFSCDGTYSGKDIAYRKLDIAQKSEVTGHKATFHIDDLRKHNGFCYAYRVDSLNN